MTTENGSPPDFDFNLSCREFKSSFARSLSLNINGNQSKSLDYDVRQCNNNNDDRNNSNSDNNGHGNNNNSNSNDGKNIYNETAAPPLPQRRLSQTGCVTAKNDSISKMSENVENDNNVPPALPARRPLSAYNNNSNIIPSENLDKKHVNSSTAQEKLETTLTQFRQSSTYKPGLPVTTKCVKQQQLQQQQIQQQQQQQHQQYPEQHFNQKLNGQQASQTQTTFYYLAKSPAAAASTVADNNNNNNNHNTHSHQQLHHEHNFRRNNNVWPTNENVEQNCNMCATKGNNGMVMETEQSQRLTKICSTDNANADYHHHQHQHQHRHHHFLNQQLQHSTTVSSNNSLLCDGHQASSSPYKLPESTTNVEAVILQNQIDTLQWQLKQVETSCNMYRAVMEEVARFLERYQTQKQKQQQQQQLQQQQSPSYKTTQNRCNNGGVNSKMEQISRSKSLFQVYQASGGHEKINEGITTETSAAYLRARSSANLIGLKQPSSTQIANGKATKLPVSVIETVNNGIDHLVDQQLSPVQSHSAFKDFTWRRPPKKSHEMHLHMHVDDVDEKLNQEAFRLLRTINNLLNTSSHQPDLTHPRHVTFANAIQNLDRLSKATSINSVLTLSPAPRLLNSTTLTSVGDAHTNTNAKSSTLANDMLFLRSANIRDSRLSLRSFTDSSVHSTTSSAASSASSKLETDEEPNIPFVAQPQQSPTVASNLTNHKHAQTSAIQATGGSSTEDESGFSSISSFPDLGIPLSSTLISNAANLPKLCKIHDPQKAKDQQQQLTDDHDCTLKANVVGLPLNALQDMSHRWDSQSKTYHNIGNTKLQRFSTLTTEDSNAVLWV